MDKHRIRRIFIVISSVLLLSLLFKLFSMPAPNMSSRVLFLANEIGFVSDAEVSPPTDDEMIAIFLKYRKYFDKAADACMKHSDCPFLKSRSYYDASKAEINALLSKQGIDKKCLEDDTCRHFAYQETIIPELRELNEKTGLSIAASMNTYMNSIYNNEVKQVVYGLIVYDRTKSPYRWKGSHYLWEKRYLYVPPLIKTKKYTNDPLKNINHDFLLDDLNELPKLIEEVELVNSPLIDVTALRKIDDNWFIELKAMGKEF